MKKTIVLALFIVLALASLSCTAQAEEGPKFVTVREWLDAKGECGDCYMAVQVREVLAPVLAVVGDETGEVNFFTGGETDLLFDFADHGDAEYYRNWFFVVSNPQYNMYEGTVEMKNWKLERFMPSGG